MRGDQTSLVWFLKGQVVTPTVDAERAHRLLRAYRPVLVWLRAKEGPTVGSIILDINDDGVSLFSEIRPTLPAGLAETTHRTFLLGPNRLEKDSVVTLDVDSVSSGRSGSDLTVVLVLEEL